MKKTSRIATACVAGALATGMLTVPASAQSAYMEPTASSHSVGDAIHDHRIVVQQAMPPQ